MDPSPRFAGRVVRRFTFHTSPSFDRASTLRGPPPRAALPALAPHAPTPPRPPEDRMARRTAKTARSKSSAKTTPARRAITADDLGRLVVVSDPQPSPDGKRVVYVHQHLGEKNEKINALWHAAADGKGKPRPFTAGPSDGHPRWSPDGSRLAFIRTAKGDQPGGQIFVIDGDGGEARALTDFPEGDVASFRWSPDGVHLAVLFRERDEDRTATALKAREDAGLSEQALVVDDWLYRFDGDGYFGAERYRLYVVDAESGQHHLLWGKDKIGFMLSYDWSPDGKRVVVATNTHKKALAKWIKTQLVLIDIATGKSRTLSDVPDGPKDAVAWSPDGKTIAYAGAFIDVDAWGVENIEAILVDVRTGKARRIMEDQDVCLEATALSDVAEVDFAPRLTWTPDGKRLLARIGWHGAERLGSIDARTGQVTKLTPDKCIVALGGLSANGRSAAYTIMTATRPPEVCVGALSKTALSKKVLTSCNGALMAELDLAAPETHWVRGADGQRVQLWTLTPPDSASKAPLASEHVRGRPAPKNRRGRHPAVVEVHGGPHAMYGYGFFHEMQLLAAKGYVVTYGNPRGSKGYGRDFCAAIRGAWGGVDWIDVQAISAHTFARDDVDHDRVAIMGGSYGGYMTNWAIGHTTCYRAAITDRCVANLVSMLGSSDICETPDNYWTGNSWDRPESLWDQSPLKYLGQAKTPTLIIHSEGDLRCNIEQSEQVFMALKHNDVPTRLVRYPKSTSHGMSRGGPIDLREHRLAQILDWYARWL